MCMRIKSRILMDTDAQFYIEMSVRMLYCSARTTIKINRTRTIDLFIIRLTYFFIFIEY